eukprot:3254632-Rhodomonas_salina.1
MISPWLPRAARLADCQANMGAQAGVAATSCRAKLCILTCTQDVIGRDAPVHIEILTVLFVRIGATLPLVSGTGRSKISDSCWIAASAVAEPRLENHHRTGRRANGRQWVACVGGCRAACPQLQSRRCTSHPADPTA